MQPVGPDRDPPFLPLPPTRGRYPSQGHPVDRADLCWLDTCARFDSAAAGPAFGEDVALKYDRCSCMHEGRTFTAVRLDKRIDKLPLR